MSHTTTATTIATMLTAMEKDAHAIYAAARAHAADTAAAARAHAAYLSYAPNPDAAAHARAHAAYDVAVEAERARNVAARVLYAMTNPICGC